MKVLLNKEDKFLVRNINADFHSKYGFVKKEDLSSNKVKTNTGVEFSVFDPQFIDIYERMRRDAQIITLKDIGTIVAESGIGKSSFVIDAGSGSGALCCFLANICKKVVSYDIRDDHLKVAQDNATVLKLKNLKFKLGDVREKIDEKNADVIILDMPDPWNALVQASKALKHGGFLVIYSPTIPQVMDTASFVKTKFQNDFIFIKTIENIQRPWEVDDRKVRPQSSFINHTGFLTFIRRI